MAVDVDFLFQERSLPGKAGKGNVVQWQVFRSRDAAVEHVRSIRLSSGQHLVGGYSRDSVGPLWWVGVRVENLDTWGNKQAINKRGASQ